MKKILLFSALLIVVSGFAETDIPKWSPRYKIVKTEVDKTLQLGEAAFDFNFHLGFDTILRNTIRFSYNGTEKTAIPDMQGKVSLKIKPGKYRFQFFYTTSYFEIFTDSIAVSAGNRTTIDVFFESAAIQVITFKPVIYLYPEKTQQVDIQLQVKGELDFTYPAYNNGWSVIADAAGTIHQNGKQYDYLFWDGKTTVNAAAPELRAGFVVKKDSLVPFFESKLLQMGLSPREAEDFITFWCPLMTKNELNYVHFEFNKGYDQFAAIQINPKPDNLFRMYMIWSEIDAGSAFQISEQKIESVTRNGFTVIEWGGSEAKGLTERIVGR